MTGLDWPRPPFVRQLVKLYANSRDGNDPERRYSPSHCIGYRVRVRHGNPNPDRISTSYVERQNLSVRLAHAIDL